MLPTSTTDQSDLSIAVVAAQAAFDAAEAARAVPLNARAKGVSADLVTDADAKAEAAAVDDPQAPPARRRDRRRGGRRRRRRDAIAAGSSTASTAPSPSPTGSRAGAARSCSRGQAAAAVYDGSELLHRGARRGRARRRRNASQVRERAHARRGARRVLLPPGPPRPAGRARTSRTGSWTRPACCATQARARSSSPGSPPAASTPGSSPRPTRGTGCPGALLVTEAGGTTAIVDREARWHVAGASAVVDELVALLT